MHRSRGNVRWSGLDAHRPRPWRQTTKCIFCGIEGSQTPEGALTKEHVYSNWTRRFVPRTLKKFKSLRGVARTDHTQFVYINRPGDIRDWQVLCVCAVCNNGWMRQQIENPARPIMIPLIIISGEPVRLSPDQQQIVATWAAAKAMVAEFAEFRVRHDTPYPKKIFDETLPTSEKRLGRMDRALSPYWGSHAMGSDSFSSPSESLGRSASRSSCYLLQRCSQHANHRPTPYSRHTFDASAPRENVSVPLAARAGDFSDLATDAFSPS